MNVPVNCKTRILYFIQLYLAAPGADSANHASAMHYSPITTEMCNDLLNNEVQCDANYKLSLGFLRLKSHLITRECVQITQMKQWDPCPGKLI